MALRSLTGRAMRLALREHFTAALSVLTALIFVALMIDFADSFDSLRAAAEGKSLSLVLGKYTLYRLTDIVSRLLPVATLLGAFLAEVRRRALLETVILAASGVSVAPTLVALGLLGGLSGALQWKLERDWRPAAVFAQVDLGAGGYADRYARGLTSDQHWFVQDDAAIVGRVLVGSRPELREASYFIGLQGRGFSQLVRAERVYPLGDGDWRFENAEIWETTAKGSLVGRPVAVLDLPLWIVPDRLEFLRPSPFYLPQDVLNARATAAPEDPKIAATQWRRYTAWLLPGLFAFLGASLAMTGFRGRVTRMPILIGMAFGGYLVTLSLKVFFALGELGALSAPIAALAPLGLALGLGAGLQWLLNREARGRRLPLG
ncbi:LptF/LptG family permease [Pseudooceanicola sp.]|uniref:LptF/LptG family permease n=1 Tax=Pseudooceanicola sp. TaxID=1914328 RepID=UPI002606D51C|nr:LptF/LptG family permease [Pseudooceanicola sp.]MDF1856027.1 LptF/LptG family permease [Pseudooceanicola sp.]